AGFNLSLQDVEGILDHFVETEGNPEVVQFSGGEPSIHPDIIPMLRMAREKGIKYVMLNTNGRRIARDDAFLAQLADVRPVIYFQFDGFDDHTTWTLRREKQLLPEKMLALDRLASIGLDVVLVPTIERHINLHEVGAIVKFGLRHPAVKGINFQPLFHAQRHIPSDPLQRLTVPDVLRAIDDQCGGTFRASDFVPVPCCFPTCNSVTYAWVDGDDVLPMTRLVEVEDYLDYLKNRSVPDLSDEIKEALEGLWSATAVPGSDNVASKFGMACAACNLPSMELDSLKDHIFMVMITDFMDPYTFNLKSLMKCCKEFLLPDGRQIPFCAYNTVGYREQVRQQLGGRRLAGVL
ncbi:MAG: radical SAM protein, partial [Chloroflexota bacterium]|nr:radical SAM protein [Chloroflexota bacterium]